MALTAKEIENAEQNAKAYKLSDSGGLCLLGSPTGAKLWRWRCRFDGKEKMMALGEYPTVCAGGDEAAASRGTEPSVGEQL